MGWTHIHSNPRAVYFPPPHLVVELAVDGLAPVVDQFEGVGAVAVHVAVAVRDAAVREQERHLVRGLRPQRNEVPEHVSILTATQRRDAHDVGYRSLTDTALNVGCSYEYLTKYDAKLKNMA